MVVVSRCARRVAACRHLICGRQTNHYIARNIIMRDLPIIKTVERHFLDRKDRNPHATAEFSWLLSGITLATKIIPSHIRRAGLLKIMGEAGRVNVQGEAVQKLDEIANETLVRCLGYRGNVGLLVSEEEDEPHLIKDSGEAGKYIVLPVCEKVTVPRGYSAGTDLVMLALAWS